MAHRHLKSGTNDPELQLTAMRTLRVLLAEDDLEMRKMLVWALRREGFEVVECPDGDRLRAHLGLKGETSDRSTYDVVISDIRMPGASGLQVLHQLGHDPERPPVILITAFPDERTQAEARRLGAAATLAKPFDMEDLMVLVRQIAPLALFVDRPSAVVDRLDRSHMDFPLEITFRHHPGTDYARAFIHHCADRLSAFSVHIEHCRVIVEPFGDPQAYRIQLRISCKGEILAVDHDSDTHNDVASLYQAVSNVFDKARHLLAHHLGKESRIR